MALKSFRKRCSNVLSAALHSVHNKSLSLWGRFPFLSQNVYISVGEREQGRTLFFTMAEKIKNMSDVRSEACTVGWFFIFQDIHACNYVI